MPPAVLGPFALQQPLAHGGMASVWRALHVAQGTPVAVKVLTAEVAEHQVDALFQEVRAVAGLRHPNVIWVHDAGEVDRAAAEASGGALRAGSPWYAMELAHGGTLATRLPAVGFAGFRDLLLDLLDALAHAHSRGVLHRDIKPANVLFRARDEPTLKLSDFGMALAMDAPGTRSGGTPSWSAPEQIRGDTAAQGPWTDLYAVGCLAWALTTGVRPFRGRSPQEVLDAHLSAPIPRLKPRITVPPGFEDWVRALMAKDPGDRYPRAADAAWALHALPTAGAGGDGGLDRPDTDEVQSRPTLVFPVMAATGGTGLAGVGAEKLQRAPVPETWRGPVVARPPTRLVGAGLGLYGLRDVPLVGRLELRDALWEALLGVHRSRRPAAVLLTGPQGSGKTRLARWLCRRAHEVGAAEVFRATHGPSQAALDGLGGLLARGLRTAAVPDDELALHVSRSVGSVPDPAWEAAALLQLVRPDLVTGTDTGSRLRQVPARERHAVALRAIERLRGGRVAIVWLDDAQWGADALAFAERALEGAGPLLVVVGACDDALDAAPEARRALERLGALPGATRHTVGPLPARTHRALIDQLLTLEADVADQVHTRSEGNPLFAVQLVGDWVQRGLLVPGPQAFALREGATPSVPADLAEMWRARVRRLLHGRPAGWRRALYLAALLGQEVDRSEWAEACGNAGTAAPAELAWSMVAQRLAVQEPAAAGRWSFVHGMLREVLCERAAGARGAKGLHRACARMLRRRGPAASARRAHHLERAGDTDAAIDAYMEASKYCGDFEQAGEVAVLEPALVLLEAASEPSDARWPYARYRRALISLHLERDEAATLEHARACAELARLASPGAEAAAQLLLASVAEHRGDLSSARSFARRALASAKQSSDPHWCWRAAFLLGAIYRSSGRGAQAEAAHTEALKHARDPGDRLLPLKQLCLLLAERGAWEEARGHLLELEAEAHLDGSRGAAAIAATAEAYVAHASGDFAAARDAYHRQREIEVQLGTEVPWSGMNLALLSIQLGDRARAKELLATVMARRITAQELWCCQTMATIVAAHERDWATFDALAPGTARASVVDRDFAHLFAEAGDALWADGEHGRARAAWTAALAQREALDDEAAVRELRERLERPAGA